MPRRQVITVIAIVIGAALSATPVNPAQTFDHNYLAYARVLSDFLVGHRVDYKRLAKNRGGLDDASEELSAVSAVALNGWTREQRLAYWINAYNLLTLRVIVDHYPIQGSWFSVYPRNSIRQIDGVWDEITWQVGGRTLTLDEIEHRILRPRFNEPLIHFAINCAAVSCPPLRDEPYRADTLVAQLADSTRKALARQNWLQLDGNTLYLTAILDWFSEDFVSSFADEIDTERPEGTRALLGLVAAYGPPEAASLTRVRTLKIRFLKYDWSLNDVCGN